MESVIEILKKLNFYKSRINYLRRSIKIFENSDDVDYEYLEYLEKELKLFESGYEKLCGNLSLDNLNIEASDGVIDLCLINKEENYLKYFLLLSNSLEIVGNIEYRGGKNLGSLGNIGYEINYNYRGNGYALRALNLLKDLILKLGKDSVIITARSDNIASIKIIEKFGGVLQPSKYQDVLVYKCEFVPKFKEELSESVEMKF